MAIRTALLRLAGAALLPLHASPAQPPAPDPAALELARVFLGFFPQPSAPSEADEERRVEEMLLSPLNRDAPCDRNDAECRAAAQAVARIYAPQGRRAAREHDERRLAFLFADGLSPDQLGRLAAHLRTEEGRLFLDAWRTMLTPISPQRRREIECRLSRTGPRPYDEARALFRQRTAHLPRTRETPPLMLPPAPAPPCSSGETP